MSNNKPGTKKTHFRAILEELTTDFSYVSWVLSY